MFRLSQARRRPRAGQHRQRADLVAADDALGLEVLRIGPVGEGSGHFVPTHHAHQSLVLVDDRHRLEVMALEERIEFFQRRLGAHEER